MADRINISSGVKWESIVGYSRAVRIGNQVFVTGTVAVDENGKVVGENDAYAQAQFIFKRIDWALDKAGAKISDVVRTRIFTTDISQWEKIGRAHGEVFKEILPCTTMVEVKALISPEYLLEIEADAIISD
ncbi:MAG: RidA family protein [Chitinophagales bacterium]